MAFIPPQDNAARAASAPGNMMLMGEYAVIEGARAVMMTLKCRLQVTLAPADRLRVTSDRFDDYADGDTNIPPYVPLIRNVLARFGDDRFSIGIASEIPATYGFGSSAALVAALVKARVPDHAFADQFEQGHQAILTTFSRGSGADLAAALADKPAIVFDPSRKSAQEFALPYVVQAIYTGYKTPTPEMLKRISYRGKTAQMAAIVEHFIHAPSDDAILAYQREMDGLGVTCDLTRRALDAFASAGAAAKISGSGLGDCVVGFSKAPLASPGVAAPLEFIPAEVLRG